MLGNGLQEVWKVAMLHKLVSGVIAVLVVGGLIAAPIIFKKPPADAVRDARVVTLIRVGDVSGAEPLSIIGEVRSRQEAAVAPDVSGTVAAVYRSLGDAVGAGTIIAELKNESQKAAVAQAQAALDKAKSITGVGTIGVDTAESAYAASQQSAASAISSAYAAIEDAVTRKADEMFSNPAGGQPHFNITVSNSQLARSAENKRVAMSDIIARERAVSGAIPTTATEELAELATLSVEAASVSDFLTTITNALSGAIATNGVTEAQIALYRADANGALSSVNALRVSLAASIQDLKSKRAAVDIAEASVSVGGTGTTADVAAAEAGLAAAEAQLEKTVIRAPISGSITRLDMHVGNFINASVPVVYITNPSGLEVVAYVSAADLSAVAVGGKAVVAGSVAGTVVRAARALDPVTKKAEIRIGLPAGSGLVSGQSVTALLERTVKSGTHELAIPLSALKITPDGAQVFTLDEGMHLVAHPVTLGALRGSSVEITEGLTADMRIVEDARGLKEGQVVVTK